MNETWSGEFVPSKCQVPITAGWTGVGMMLGGKPSHCWMEMMMTEHHANTGVRNIGISAISAKNIGIGYRQYYKMYIGNQHLTLIFYGKIDHKIVKSYTEKEKKLNKVVYQTPLS